VTTYSYADSGNNTVQDAGGAVTTYAWDGENRLTAIALPDGAVQTMTYDATGLRLDPTNGAPAAKIGVDYIRGQ